MKKVVKGFASVILASMIFVVGCKPPTSTSEPSTGGSEPQITVTVQGDEHVDNIITKTLSVAKGSTWSTIKSNITVTPKKGFVEAGWKLDNADGDDLTDDYKFEKDTTVFAVSKEAVTVTVTHDDGVDKVESATLSVAKGSEWSAVKPRIKVKYKDGFVEAGWKLDNADGDVLTDDKKFEKDTTVYAYSKDTVTVGVQGDERIVLSSLLQIEKPYNTPWSSIKAEIEGKIKLTADWKNGDYEFYEWRLGSENGKKISDDYRFTDNTTIYAVSNYNYKKWEIEDDGSGNKVLFGVKEGSSKPRGKIIIPEDVTSIGDAAFKECTSLASITIPAGVKTIGDGAFKECTSLKSIKLPKDLTSIGRWAFDGCSNLASIEIPATVTSIGSSAFKGCSSLTSITIPARVTEIELSAFEGCSRLTSITIPAGVKTIGGSAFYGCTSLKSITIPERVTSIGNDAFSGCSSLTSATFADPNGWKDYSDNTVDVSTPQKAIEALKKGGIHKE